MKLTYAIRAVCTAALISFCAQHPTQTTAQTPTQTPTPPSAQTPTQSAAPAPTSFAAEPYVVKTASTVVSVNPDGTGTRVLTFAAILQSEAALRQSSVVAVSYASHAEHADFTYVRAVHPDGSIEETPVSSAIEQPAPVTQQAPLYSDLETKQIPVRSLRVGDTIEWQVRFTTDHPEAPNQSWGQDSFITGVVVLDETYEVRVPSAVHITAWTNPAAHGAFTESEAAGTHIYRWHNAELRPSVGPEADAWRKSEEARRRTPDEELALEKGALPSFAWTTFPDWAAVGAWYRSLSAERAVPDDAIKAKVAELTAGKSSDLEKAQAVYSYVSSQIRYIGVDFGVGRYQPHTAAEVFANRYGDCKDKHTLLAAMLSVLNLHADPVMIGAGIRFNSAVPAPTSFNHLITRLSLNGKDVWLDSTAEVGIWGALLKPIRDQDALVVPASAPPAIVRTPADLPYPQTNTFSVQGTLDKDLTSESKVVFTFHDDNELYLRAALHSVSPANYADFVQGLMAGMGFGGTTSDPAFDHLDDPSQPLQITFHYHRVKDKDWGENRITAIFQAVGMPSYTPDKPPTSAILLGSPRTEISTLDLQLPPGWNATPPDPVHAHAAFANCDVTYSVKDGKLHAERRLTILKDKVPVEDLKQYQSWYDQAGAGDYPYLQLFPAAKVTVSSTLPLPVLPDVPTGPAASAASAKPTAKPSDPKAADLVQQAATDIRNLDLDSARKHLDQAAVINPTEPYLWSSYAQVAQMLGVMTQVFDDLQRELSYHPGEARFYSLVANHLAATGDRNGELATLRSWVKAAPDSPEAAAQLANLLLDLDRPAEAAVEANVALDALAALPDADRVSLRIVAAKAKVRLGHPMDAADDVAPLLDTLTDPDQINQVAHMLAEANQDTNDAVAAEQALITHTEADSANWSPTGNLRDINQQQSRLTAAWSTLALLLFDQAHTGQALGYALASFYGDNTQQAHDVLAAINAVARDPRATAALHMEEQGLRTFSLGPVKGRPGVAFFTLALANGKVVSSNPDKSSSSVSTPSLPNADSYLRTVDLHALFPPNSQAHLIRGAAVNCHIGGCELVLVPLSNHPSPTTMPPPKGASPVRRLTVTRH